MKKILPFILFSTALFFSCSGDKPVDTPPTDSIPDSIIANSTLPDSTKAKFRMIVTALPVPFDILNRFSGAHLPFHGEFLNAPDHCGSYTLGKDQALNLGIYGADLAYMISQDKLGESAPFLKSIRTLSDAIVIPTAFDANILSRYETNSSRKDSMQMLVNTSYKRIDSTLQSNDRLVLASLVIYGGWLESMYLTTQHIGNEKQNDKNKVLFDMLSLQQPYVDNITELLAQFPSDSTCAWLHRDIISMNSAFPKPEMTPDDFSKQLLVLNAKLVATRNKIVNIQ
ncbi:MAG TPA: hypothetical protein VL651_04100 [Bacteroidia bacterium]|jgi:hypothetical protein|nr:hypothetical protein [Bacteroidia bacterium]